MYIMYTSYYECSNQNIEIMTERSNLNKAEEIAIVELETRHSKKVCQLVS